MEVAMAKRNHTWAVAKAKAQFSALIDRALADGPQTITRSGRKAVVVVSVEQWEQKTKPKGSIVEFFLNSPLHGSGLRTTRLEGTAREIEL
jgi:prevent-host-death family protein